MSSANIIGKKTRVLINDYFGFISLIEIFTVLIRFLTILELLIIQILITFNSISNYQQNILIRSTKNVDFIDGNSINEKFRIFFKQHSVSYVTDEKTQILN